MCCPRCLRSTQLTFANIGTHTNRRCLWPIRPWSTDLGKSTIHYSYAACPYDNSTIHQFVVLCLPLCSSSFIVVVVVLYGGGGVQIEAMVPFASPNPTPASERRRVRSAKTFLFSITAGRNGTYTTFVTGNGGGGGGGGVSGASRRPAAAPAVAPRRGVSNRCRSSSGGEEDCARYRYHPTSLEEQLYAGLGALLEVSACYIRVEPLRERQRTQHEDAFFSFSNQPRVILCFS